MDTVRSSFGRRATFVSRAATVNPVAVGVHTALPARNAKTRSATLSRERFPDDPRDRPNLNSTWKLRRVR